MKKSKFTEEQIVFVLKEHQQGTKVGVIARELRYSQFFEPGNKLQSGSSVKGAKPEEQEAI
jgi:hypothetical protein